MPVRSSTFIITGQHCPYGVANKCKMTKCLNSYFRNFHHIELKTVIRGTLSIINEWKRFFPDRFFVLGHNVQGAPVERIYVKSGFDLKYIVFKILSDLLKISTTDRTLFGEFQFVFFPYHIAILSHHAKIFKSLFEKIKFKNFLEDNGYPCGDIEEQLCNKNLIAIDWEYISLSFDWPVVIYIRRKGDESENHEIIAFSRCISKLIIIEIERPAK
jgi:hypothetical protein